MISHLKSRRPRCGNARCVPTSPHKSTNARYKSRRETDRVENSGSEATKFCIATMEVCESVARAEASLNERRFLVCDSFHFFAVANLDATDLNFCFGTSGIVRKIAASRLEQEYKHITIRMVLKVFGRCADRHDKRDNHVVGTKTMIKNA